jgi:hypothetical protein
MLFLELYGTFFDFEKGIISVDQGGYESIECFFLSLSFRYFYSLLPSPRSLARWHHLLATPHNLPLLITDPFNSTKNVGASAFMMWQVRYPFLFATSILTL